jgi:hypothetical protein
VIRFGAGVTPWIADFAAWFACVTAAMAVQAVLCGQPSRDRLQDRIKARPR